MTWQSNHSSAALSGLKIPVDDGTTAGGSHKLGSELLGQTGATGPQGPAGPAGATGPQGPAGSSALTVIQIDGSTIPASSSTPYVMQPGDRVIYVNKTTGAATSITLPSSPVIGVTYDIKDGKNDSQTNPITVTAPNSGTIDGASTLVISSSAHPARSLKAITSTVWALV